MPDSSIPAQVARLVVDYLPSVVHVEALLYLRARPAQALGPVAIAQALFVGEAVARRTLEELCGHGLLRGPPPDGPFEYAPSSPELRAAIDELADTHRTRLIPLSDFIHKQADSRSIQAFANAFRLRKD